ncbi:MAG: hypothetical protein AB1696_16750 [Planctomycetota bacterium]
MTSRKRTSMLCGAIALIAAASLEFFGIKQVYYTRVCIDCLKEEPMYEVHLFGIRIRHVRRAEDLNQSIGASVFEEILGYSCPHRYKKAGFCERTGLVFGGSVMCGEYAEGALHHYRKQAIQQLYIAYGRIPNRASAQTAYKMIDELSAAGKFGDKSLRSLAEKLSEVDETDDWDRVIPAFRRARKKEGTEADGEKHQ